MSMAEDVQAQHVQAPQAPAPSRPFDALRYQARDWLAWLRVQRKRVAVWDWERAPLPGIAGTAVNFTHWGRKDQRTWVTQLLALDTEQPEAQAAHPGAPTTLVTDLPLPGAFCVPRLVSTIVPLDRSLDEFFAALDSELRRRIRKQLPTCRVVQASTDAEIEFAESQMLRPYAAARRGDGAIQLDKGSVFHMARTGRLDIVYLDDEPVSCTLGYPLVRHHKRYWSALRYGFTEAVFSDRKRWGEINGLNNFLVMRSALEQHYDFYDIGYSVARPDDGLLQWKKRQGGVVGRMHNHGYDYVRMPEAVRPELLWHAPLFAIERGAVTLNLGIPANETVESVAKRYRHMGFDGLSNVYVYTRHAATEELGAALRKLYSHLKAPPTVHLRQVE